MTKIPAISVISGLVLLLIGQPVGAPIAQSARAPILGLTYLHPESDTPVEIAHDNSVLELESEELDTVVRTYCQVCHNDVMLTGNMSLSEFQIDSALDRAETVEKMIVKLRAGMMPPPGMPRPSPDTLLALVTTLEGKMDEAYADNPNPGVRTFPRLNRAEYSGMVRDLVGLEVDAGDWLPLDTKSNNFDNFGDAQSLSPTLLEAYLNAAGEISRMAVGNDQAPRINTTYTNANYISQHPWDHVPGAPYGTRGGMVINHHFAADAQYHFEMTFSMGNNSRGHDLDISIDGEHAQTLQYERYDRGVSLQTEPFFVPAGQHQVSAAFIRRAEGPYEDLIRPHDWSQAGGGSGGAGITTLPHLKDLVVVGPYNITGISETPSREMIFTCRPTSLDEEVPCAQEILGALATKAYRRPLIPGELENLMEFFKDSRQEDGFEIGIRTGLEAILSSPHTIFRLEREMDVAAGENYEISDMELATRLGVFLWNALPDEELLDVAKQGRLRDDAELERQTRRMLKDPRAEAMGSRFAHQWLRLQDLYKNHPDPNFFPNFDENLADAMVTETEMLFNNLVREDRSLLDLYNADYTFLNERLARHYGYQGVSGEHFRRVESIDARKGILGHGSVLVLTALADRTSPVLRGKWVMEVLLGTPPPPPPDNVPDLEVTAGSDGSRFLTTRERMELHRASPACQSCHKFMDPMGLALDNFDVTGQWRIRERGQPLDTRGELYDGTPISNPDELVTALLERPIPLVRTFTLNLMAYAMGRRVEWYDQPVLRDITRAAEADGYSISSLIVGVVKSDPFRMKKAAALAEDAAENEIN